MSNPRRRTKLTTLSTRLWVAVKPVDADTGRLAAGSPAVSLADIDVEPRRHRSGYALFTDLPEDLFTATIKVDGGDRYRDETRPVRFSELNPGHPAVEITLYPTDATVVRGEVRDGTDDRVAGVEVSVRGLDLSSTSDENGTYVLYFRDGLNFDVEVQDGRRLLKVDSRDPQLVVDPDPSDPDADRTFVRVIVEEGVEKYRILRVND